MQREKRGSESAYKVGGRRITVIIIAAILSMVLLLGIVLGGILIVREANAAVSYNGISITKGIASYIASTYKASYIGRLRDQQIEAYDGAEFWQSECREGVSYKDDFAAELENHIRYLVVSAYFFDRYAALSSTERAWIEEKTRSVLDLNADGSVAKFNEMAEPMGFTYSDFKGAIEFLYKAERAVTAVYGQDGTGLATESNIPLCNEYLSEYAHVRLLYIRKNDKFMLDDNGNRVVENGRDVTTPLTNEEKAARTEDIASIKAAIEAWRTGGNGGITEIYFESFFERYNDEPDYAENGYYFKDGTPYTAWYDKYAYEGVIDAAMAMEIGEFDWVELDEAVIFIYRTDCVPGAYMAYGLEDFFVGFYSDLAQKHFSEMTGELLSEVSVKDIYREIDLVDIFQNTTFKIK